MIDGLILIVVTGPVLTIYYGESYWTNVGSSAGLIQGPLDFILSYLFPAVAIISFWVAKQATPGKMAIRAKILDARTGRPPGIGQYIGRYFAYIVSATPLGLGFFWIAFDARKQGWHDKLAGTVVVSPKVFEQKEVKFDHS